MSRVISGTFVLTAIREYEGHGGASQIKLYKASYDVPTHPSESLDGWSENAPELIEGIEVRHGGLWIKESDGRYRSPIDAGGLNRIGVEERFYFNNTNNHDILLPCQLSASTEEGYDIGHLIAKTDSTGQIVANVNDKIVNSENQIALGKYLHNAGSIELVRNSVVSVSGSEKKSFYIKLPVGMSFVTLVYIKDRSGSDGNDCITIEFGNRPIWECTKTVQEDNVSYGTLVKSSNFDSRVSSLPSYQIQDNLFKGARFAQGRHDRWETVNGGVFDIGFGRNYMFYAPLNSGYAHEVLRYEVYNIENIDDSLTSDASFVLSFWASGTNWGIHLTGIFKGRFTTDDGETKEFTVYERYDVVDSDFTGVVFDGKLYKKGVSFGTPQSDYTLSYHTIAFNSDFKDKEVVESSITVNGETYYNVTVTYEVQKVLLRFFYSDLGEDDGQATGVRGQFLMPKIENVVQYPTEFNVNDSDVEGLPGKLLYPAGIWNDSTVYLSDETTSPYVAVKEKNESGGDYTYYWLNKEIGTGINPSTDTTGTWKKFNNFQAVFADALVADFAKLSSAVFYQDYMFSQYGTDGAKVTNYADFASAGKFEQFVPNIKLDFKTGKAQFRNIDISGNAKFEGTVKAKNFFHAVKRVVFGGDLNINDADIVIIGNGFGSATDDKAASSTLTLPDYSKYVGKLVTVHNTSTDGKHKYITSANGGIDNNGGGLVNIVGHSKKVFYADTDGWYTVENVLKA